MYQEDRLVELKKTIIDTAIKQLSKKVDNFLSFQDKIIPFLPQQTIVEEVESIYKQY